MRGKIPVTVVSGFLGSGKTTLLNRLLNANGASPADAAAAAGIVVVVNELGAVGLDHMLLRHITDSVVLLESGCICCTVRGELVDALRELFLAALHKKIPAFSRIMIEATGMADPAPVIYTLKYERFLSDRYAYDGCISVIDGTHGARQLREEAVAVRQAVLADALAISKTDLASPQETAQLERLLRQLNPQAAQYHAQNAPGLAELLSASSLRAGVAGVSPGAGLWAGRIASPAPPVHGSVEMLTMAWALPARRPAFIKAMSMLLADTGLEILRLKGVVWFEGDDHPSAVHGVHRQLYPIEPGAAEVHAGALPQDAAHGPGGADAAPLPAAGVRACVLVLIFRGLGRAQVQARLDALLPGGRALMSPDGNFVQ